MKRILFTLCTMLLFSCNSSSDKAIEKYNRMVPPEGIQVSPTSGSGISNMNAYEVMETAFEGYPSKEKIKPMLEEVMKRYGMPVNNENLLHAANVLVAMKNESKVGVTEMDVLKHIYQHGSASGDYVTNIAISATILEQTK